MQSVVDHLVDQIETLEGLVLKSRQPTDDNDCGDRAAALERARCLMTKIRPLPGPYTNFALERWTHLIQLLQDLAYVEPDNGDVEISRWCEGQWAQTLACHPHDMNTMQGLGQLWLFKAQPSLARIYERERSPSPEDRVQAYHLGLARPLADPSEAEHTARINSSDYIEARALLHPAIEHLDKAVAEAELRGVTNGKLMECVRMGPPDSIRPY
jgi:hypothetical protein